MARNLRIFVSLALAAVFLGGCELIGYLVDPNLRQAALADLTVTPGAMTPAFSSRTSTYEVSVAAGTPSFTITPRSVSPTATIEVMVDLNDWVVVPSGVASPVIPLDYGSALIEIQVTAEDGTTTSLYWVHVTD